MKHNKKRNTAFLYETLLRELTKSVVRKLHERKNKVIEVIKDNFHKDSLLRKDLNIYKSILENKDKMTNEFTDRFLLETKKDYNSIDRKKVFNSQTHLISQINQKLGSGVFNNFIPNYKNIATVGSWLQDSKLNAKSRLIIETKVKSLLVPAKKEHKEMKHIDNLTYRTFVQKFNNTYKNSLKENQKNLLTNYIISFSDNGLGLKTFVNEELGYLKKKTSDKLNKLKGSDNNKLFENLSKVSSFLEEFGRKPLNEQMVIKLFYIQDLLEEL